MNLYLLERTDEIGWDEYDAIVVAATSPKKARAMFPWPKFPYGPPVERREESLVVKLIGKAAAGIEAGEVLSSYHAG